MFREGRNKKRGGGGGREQEERGEEGNERRGEDFSLLIKSGVCVNGEGKKKRVVER